MPEAVVSSRKDYVAILDIGSNAVRLVVYDGINRAPVKIHNERNICSLGADLSVTGQLSPEGVEKALGSIGRFASLIAAMKIKNVRAVATAALRDAADGADFIAKVKRDYGLSITVIDGEEEARLSAIGVMMNGLGRQGLIGDYGGGSLELIGVVGNQLRHKQSLPVGSHRLRAQKGHALRTGAVDKHLDSVAFLADYHGGDFYALGGSWRTLAKVHMRLTAHPLKVMDQYSIPGAAALEFVTEISRQTPAALQQSTGLSEKRTADMAVSALALSRVLDRLRPARVIFSATGLREGLIYDSLPPALQKQDALMASCRKIALKISRFDDLKAFQAMVDWMRPLFAGEETEFFRLLEAAALLSDTGWFEHEDYQANHAFNRILLLPVYGIDHPGRAFLALANYVRYGGDGADDVASAIRKMLDESGIVRAVTAGLAMRVGYLLTGGALSLLKNTALTVTERELVLALKKNAAGLRAEVIESALRDLAEMTGRSSAVQVQY